MKTRLLKKVRKKANKSIRIKYDISFGTGTKCPLGQPIVLYDIVETYGDTDYPREHCTDPATAATALIKERRKKAYEIVYRLRTERQLLPKGYKGYPIK